MAKRIGSPCAKHRIIDTGRKIVPMREVTGKGGLGTSKADCARERGETVREAERGKIY